MLKKLAGHTLIYAIGNIGVRAASFLLIPIFTRTLPQSDFGLLSTLLMTNQMFLALMDAGMRDAIVRFFRESHDDDNVGVLLGSSLLVSGAMGLLLTGVVLLFLGPLFQDLLHASDVSFYMTITCLVSLLQALCLQLMTYYRARGLPIAFLVAGIASAILLLGLNVIALMVLELGVSGALIAYMSTYVVAIVVLAIHIVSQTGISVSRAMVVSNLRFGVPLVISQGAAMLMTALPIYFLSHYHGLAAVAIFSVGQKLSQLLEPFLVLPFQQALEPMVFNNLDDKDLPEKLGDMLTYFVLVFAVATLCFMAGSRILLSLAAPSAYGEAALVLAALLPIAFSLGITYFGRVLVHIHLRTGITGAIGIVFGCLSPIIFYLLIPRYGIYGALVATNIVWILQGAAFLVFGLRTYTVPLDKRRLGIAGTALLTVYILFMLSTTLSHLHFYLLVLLLVPVGGAMFKLTRFFNEDEKAAMCLFWEQCRCRLKR